MKKLYLILFFFLNSPFLFSQQPYIGSNGGDGLGQYGYLEKDAITFSRLFRNTYNNIAFLSARWWITDNNSANGNGKEYIYHVYDFPVSAGGDWDPLVGWQCGGNNDGSKRTNDYNAANFSPEWGAGSDCSVSVCAKYCDNSFYPPSFNGTSTNGAVGFNERHFQVIDVDTTVHISTSSLIPDGNGVCSTNSAVHVAGSFAIDPGNQTGIALTNLFIQNNGTALEGTDIPNAAFNVFYEPATGSEIYGDGNETFAGTLYGDWGGGSLTDNIFGNASLNIPLNGKTRIYVLLCDFNSPVAIGKLINLSIINDGISLSPALDSYTKLRINASGISQRNILLPVKFISFTGERTNHQVNLRWQLSDAMVTDQLTIQESTDGIHFSNITTLSPNTDLTNINYRYSFNSRAGYFRIQVKSMDGTNVYSTTLKLKNSNNSITELMQNPVHNQLQLLYNGVSLSPYL